MVKTPTSTAPLLFLYLVIISSQLLILTSEARRCRPSGKLRGRRPPPGGCDSDCCEEGKLYTTYKCSPPVTRRTKAILTLNSFEEGGEGGAPSECDGSYHSNDTPIVALSTGWFNHMERCHNNITISMNGRSVEAMVVDECDSTAGCDEEHGYLPPCPNNVVDASRAVWEALGVPRDQWGWMDVVWSDV